jgi:hypothetical protein
MVNYRLHNLSMTNTLTGRDSSILSRDLLALCWRMREKISATGNRALERHCEREFYRRYFAHIMHNSMINLEELTQYLHNFSRDLRARDAIEKKAVGRLIFQLYLNQEFERARGMYKFAVRRKRWTGPVLWADYICLKLDRYGIPFARAASLFKRQAVGVGGL